MLFVISPTVCRNCNRHNSFEAKRKRCKSIPVRMISDKQVSLLVLSNGHGEDKVSVSVIRRVIDLLRYLPLKTSIDVLPLVGKGSSYKSISQVVNLLGPVKEFSSGGFVTHRPLVFLRDIKEGLLALTYAQFQTISKWSSDRAGRKLILAVGDIWPVFLAAQSRIPFIFIGTAKSEYYVRDERGPLQRRNLLEQTESMLSSVYYPWERILLKKAIAVYPRDTLTCLYLSKSGLTNVKYFGNPMMDDLEPSGKLVSKIHASAFLSNVLQHCHNYRIVLLPGSRQDEMYRNIDKLLTCIKEFAKENRALFLLSCPSSASAKLIDPIICRSGWSSSSNSEDIMEYKLASSGLLVSFEEFSDCLHFCSVGVAMAGTATEQLVGIGKPVITFPGDGPQFTYSFAEAQKRLLGESVFFVRNGNQVGSLLQELCELNTSWRKKFVANGTRRMGVPGASMKIARDIVHIIQSISDNDQAN